MNRWLPYAEENIYVRAKVLVFALQAVRAVRRAPNQGMGSGGDCRRDASALQDINIILHLSLPASETSRKACCGWKVGRVEERAATLQ
jgi:hypothetical protein